MRSGHGFMRERSWWRTLAWLSTRPWGGDDSAFSVSLKKTSSGPIWNTAATVGKHTNKPHITLSSNILNCYDIARVLLLRKRRRRLWLESVWPHLSLSDLLRHHPRGFPGVQHSARRWLALKSKKKTNKRRRRISEECISVWMCVSVQACVSVCVCLRIDVYSFCAYMTTRFCTVHSYYLQSYAKIYGHLALR